MESDFSPNCKWWRIACHHCLNSFEWCLPGVRKHWSPCHALNSYTSAIWIAFSSQDCLVDIIAHIFGKQARFLTEILSPQVIQLDGEHENVPLCSAWDWWIDGKKEKLLKLLPFVPTQKVKKAEEGCSRNCVAHIPRVESEAVKAVTSLEVRRG